MHQHRYACVENIDDLPYWLRGSAVAIGNFDGFHRGHQAVIAKTKSWAKERCVPSIALTFEPHPRDFFRGEGAVLRLTNRTSKSALARALGLDGLVVLPFDAALSNLEAADFIGRYLKSGIGCAGAFVGQHFRFGRGRHGDVELLSRVGKRSGIEVVGIDLAKDDSDVVSSTRVRASLSAGEIVDVNNMLGFKWFFSAFLERTAKKTSAVGLRSEQLAKLPQGDYVVRGGTDCWAFEGVAHIALPGSRTAVATFSEEVPIRNGERCRISLLRRIEGKTTPSESVTLSELDRAIGII